MARTIDYNTFMQQRIKVKGGSFSVFEAWATCSLQAFAGNLKVSSMEFQENVHSVWGNHGHNCLEAVVRNAVGLPHTKDSKKVFQYVHNLHKWQLPADMAVWQPIMDNIQAHHAAGWTVIPEADWAYRLSDGTLTKSNNFGEAIYRCRMDLVMLSPCGVYLKVIDWKTGKPKNPRFYAKYPINRMGEEGVYTVELDATKQIEYSIPAAFQAYPSVQQIDGTIAYLHHDQVATSSYRRSDIPKALWEAQQITASINTDIKIGRIAPIEKPNRLCSEYCPNHVCSNSFNWDGKPHYIITDTVADLKSQPPRKFVDGGVVDA